MYHLLQHTKTLNFALRVYLCVPFGSHNKQRLCHPVPGGYKYGNLALQVGGVSD
jgi:hypothetical protein